MKHWKEMNREELEDFTIAMGLRGFDAWEESLSLSDMLHLARVVQGFATIGDAIEAECNWRWFGVDLTQ